jgi:hypothetical protein
MEAALRSASVLAKSSAHIRYATREGSSDADTCLEEEEFAGYCPPWPDPKGSQMATPAHNASISSSRAAISSLED